jgi:hypothetical protein
MVLNRADLQFGNGVTGLKFCDVDGGIVHKAELSKCVDCMT